MQESPRLLIALEVGPAPVSFWLVLLARVRLRQPRREKALDGETLAHPSEGRTHGKSKN
ncbi:MAG: hypothetical protein AAGA75_24170 [Cyanobacteria bacterium P01_E01_bin.6]